MLDSFVMFLSLLFCGLEHGCQCPILSAQGNNIFSITIWNLSHIEVEETKKY